MLVDLVLTGHLVAAIVEVSMRTSPRKILKQPTGTRTGDSPALGPRVSLPPKSLLGALVLVALLLAMPCGNVFAQAPTVNGQF